eukprot:GFYU01004039.1.p1 GENE.GFYU01004039.1~~GFYU01004039.1.p1  ORF type:complete len:276 (+),score=77.57 GFYU01004039.1:93-920(+)
MNTVGKRLAVIANRSFSSRPYTWAAVAAPVRSQTRTVYNAAAFSRMGRTDASVGIARSSPMNGVITRSLFIQTEATPNPNSTKFYPGQEVLEEGTASFSSLEQARTSPLARLLLRVEGVDKVFFTQEYITVTKGEDYSWTTIKPDVYAIVTDHFTSNSPVMTGAQAPSDTTILPEDDEVVATIKELLETRVRPYVQDDGGDIEYHGFVDGIVRVQLKGSCDGCPSSSITLKHGIENMLMHYVPEVEGIEQVFDEADEVGLAEFDKLEAELKSKQQ